MNSVSNNNSVSYQAANIGVLTAPDSVGKVTLYSAKDTDMLYKQMSQDIYSRQKKVDFLDDKKTPKPVLYTAGITVLTFLGFVIKKLIKK